MEAPPNAWQHLNRARRAEDLAAAFEDASVLVGPPRGDGAVEELPLGGAVPGGRAAAADGDDDAFDDDGWAPEQ